MRKKWLSVLLALAMVAGLLPASALAAPAGESTAGGGIVASRAISAEASYINPIFDGDAAGAELAREMRQEGIAPRTFALEDETELASFTSVEEAGLYMRQQLEARQESITFAYSTFQSFDSSVLTDIYRLAIEHTGVPTQGDYLQHHLRGWVANVSGYLNPETGQYVLTLSYSVTYTTTQAQEVELDGLCNRVLAGLAPEGKNDYEKISAVYDYICGHVTYDNAHLQDESYLAKFTAYAALVDGTAVCQGYAALLYRMLLALGVDCRIVTGKGNGGNHAWNIAGLAGNYYNLDATWDAGRSTYSYFLKSEGGFGNHIRESAFTTEEFLQLYPMGQTDVDPANPPEEPDNRNRDFNQDGIVNLKDVSILFRAVSRDEDLPNGDVDGDGVLSLKDVFALFSLVR